MGSSCCTGGHLCGRGALDQRALGDQRLADASSDGRGHVGVAEVDRGVVLRGLGGGHGGLGLAVRRHGVVVFLLADRIGLDQRRVAIGQHLGAEQIGLRLLELGGGLIVGRLVRRRIDLEEQLLLLDVAALLESDLLDDAGHPRADLRIADRIDTAGQLRHDRRALGLDRDDADLGHAGVHLRVLAAPANSSASAPPERARPETRLGENRIETPRSMPRQVSKIVRRLRAAMANARSAPGRAPE